MSLSMAPAIWQMFINNVLDQIPDRKHYLVTMGKYMIPSKEKDHLSHLIVFSLSLIRNGLKISPRNVNYLDRN